MEKPEADPAAERLARDLAMMRDPKRWPHWPVLPLKKRNGNWNDQDYCAFLYADLKPVAYLANIMMIPKTLTERECHRYATMDELAADYTVD